jgi:hypothetical protein
MDREGTMFRTVEEIKAANERLGHYWFTAATMETWGTQIESEVIRGHWFITSEDHPSGSRRFSVRHATSDGDVHTDRRTNAGDYTSRWDAREEIDRLLTTLSTCGCD